MTDEPAFIRMIAAAPDDDAPRLVYADVLEERGDPAGAARAEFIRVQCERARLVPDTPRSRELWFRDAALLDWARHWRAELPAVEGVQFGGFIRGFIDQVRASADPLARHFRMVIDSVPLRKVTLTHLDLQGARALAQSPDLEEVVEIEIGPVTRIDTPSIWRAFARRGPWSRLRRFKVIWYPSSDDRLNAAWRRVWDELRTAFGDRLTA
jgi:uncharacterized protein (TIGR02996 family)